MASSHYLLPRGGGAAAGLRRRYLQRGRAAAAGGAGCRGQSFGDAIFNGAEQRMRPMLMTALSAGVGLFPAAISQGIGSQVQRPLATVVVGGMLLGPIMLLVVGPALRRVLLRV